MKIMMEMQDAKNYIIINVSEMILQICYVQVQKKQPGRSLRNKSPFEMFTDAITAQT